MRKYLLDTNICAYFLNGKYHLDVKIAAIGIENCAISEITIAELKYGIKKIIMSTYQAASGAGAEVTFYLISRNIYISFFLGYGGIRDGNKSIVKR